MSLGIIKFDVDSWLPEVVQILSRLYLSSAGRRKVDYFVKRNSIKIFRPVRIVKDKNTITYLQNLLASTTDAD